MAAEWFTDLSYFFKNRKPTELAKEQFDALKLRWGFKDGYVYRIKEVVKHLQINENDYLIAEKNLIQRLGIRMDTSKVVESKWRKL
jgi:hypothetical protein